MWGGGWVEGLRYNVPYKSKEFPRGGFVHLENTNMKKILRKVPFLEIEEAILSGNTGFCLVCGELHDCVEPDATEYVCEVCGEHAVYGAEEILIMGMAEEPE